MDIQTQHWVAIDQSPPSHSTIYQCVQSVEINGEEAIFAVIAEALPAIHHSAAYYSLHQRSQKGAEIAIESSLKAFNTLVEHPLNFSRDFMNLLSKNWNNSISLHFISHPLTEEESQKNHHPQHIAAPHQSSQGLLNLSKLYDTAISAILLTDKELLVYQVGYSQLLLLNKQHTITIKTQKRDLHTPFSQFLAHPDIATSYPCQRIDLNDYSLEMMILYTNQYNATKTTQQIHDHAYQLACELDTKGVCYVKQLYTPPHNANQLIIKRTRRWYNGVISALNRESHHLHHKIELQNQQLHTLESKIYQLHQYAQPTQAQHKLDVAPQPNPVAPSTSTPSIHTKILLITLSSLTVTAVSLISYFLWQHAVNDRSLHQASLISPLTTPPLTPPSRNLLSQKSTLAPPKQYTLLNKTEQKEKIEEKTIRKDKQTVFSNIRLNQSTPSTIRKGLQRYTHIISTLKPNILHDYNRSQTTTLPPSKSKAVRKKDKVASTIPIKIVSANSISPLKPHKQHASSKRVRRQKKITQPKKRNQQYRALKRSSPDVNTTKKPKKRQQHSPKKVISNRKKSTVTRPLLVVKTTYHPKIRPTPSTKRRPKQPSLNKVIIKQPAQVRTPAQAQKALEKIQKQTIVQQIIISSTTFASHALRLNKKNKEIKVMNELLIATKNAHYAQQKQRLKRRKQQLNQKMQHLAQQYSQQLKRLCRYTQPYNPRLLPHATPLEQLALRNLKQHLRHCTQPKTLSTHFIEHTLRNYYQKLANRL